MEGERRFRARVKALRRPIQVRDSSLRAVGSPAVFVLDIEKFCGGCDQFVPAKVACKVADVPNQVRYVDGKWCGWASVQKARGAMTAMGFQRAPRPASPQTAR